jgi:hypothetical protein
MVIFKSQELRYVRYHPTVEKALQSVFEHRLMNSIKNNEITNLHDFLRRTEALNKELKETLAGMKIENSNGEV